MFNSHNLTYLIKIRFGFYATMCIWVSFYARCAFLSFNWIITKIFSISSLWIKIYLMPIKNYFSRLFRVSESTAIKLNMVREHHLHPQQLSILLIYHSSVDKSVRLLLSERKINRLLIEQSINASINDSCLSFRTHSNSFPLMCHWVTTTLLH